MPALPLPVEIEPTTTNRVAWLPIVTAGSLLLVANLVMVMFRFSHSPRHEEQLLSSKWKIAASGESSFEWIIVGDSSGTLGIDPTTMTIQLGQSTANLCTFGSMGLTGDLWMVQKYLETHPPPRGVIVVHSADTWTRGNTDALYQYTAAIPESTPAILGRLLATGALPSQIFQTLYYRDWFPLLLIKDRMRIQLGWSPPDPNGIADQPQPERNGRWLLPASAINPGNVIRHSNQYWIDWQDDGLDRQSRRALERLVDLAERDRFELHLANGPISELVRQSEEFGLRTAKLQDQLHEIADRSASVDVLLEDWESFPAEQMENANHVVGEGVQSYTDSLIRSLLEKR